MKYLLLDVAGTILYKPELFNNIIEVLKENDYNVNLRDLKLNHKLLSEVIRFPDRTDSDFYLNFNSELLYSLGIVPNDSLMEKLFKACSYLPWEKFDDATVLNDIEIPIGILSNFNSSLTEKLTQFFGPVFSNIFISENLGVAKPSLAFYKKALEVIDIEPKDILYIGDSFKLDFKPAVELGMRTYVVDRDGFYGSNDNTIASLSQVKHLI